MIDVTIVGIYTLATSALGASAHMMTYRKISAIQKALKMQRIELTSLEVLTLLGTGVSALESYIWKREYKRAKQLTDETTAALMYRVNELTDRINKLNLSTIDSKLDKVIESTANKQSDKETKES